MIQSVSINPGSVELAILCGGRGVRLKPLTDDIPKALVSIQGRPMLDHIVAFFAERGFDRYTLCVGYKAECIRNHFTQSPHRGDFRFSDMGETASMLKRLWALRQTDREHVLIVYGDTFINLDLEQLFAHHKRSGAQVTIVTAAIRNPFGVIRFDAEYRVESFLEKPVSHHYIGCFVMERDAFLRIDETMLSLPDGEGLVSFFHTLIAERTLSAFPHSGLQITFNTEIERRRAEKELGEYFTYPERTL
ncbi:MAG: nucleotidyltransferase family protein [Magnetococcales bacterium]|nr:nucleotidyltransferase family protein [Magnetococcales bacterium]MBF0419417.1 nucleotidyltransferase family protein [Magnetococcales bacterium]